MIKEIIVPEELRTRVQRANVERDSRRDILLYIMSHDDIDILKKELLVIKKNTMKNILNLNKQKVLLKKNM